MSNQSYGFKLVTDGPDIHITHLSQLHPDRENARGHSQRNLDMIVRSLGEVGAARSIVVDEDGNVLAGNATIDAASIAGIENVRVVDADGETIIAVRRSGLTADQKKRLAYYDNRTAELAFWEAERMLADMEVGVDLSGMFSDKELAHILEDLDVIGEDGQEAEVKPTLITCPNCGHQWAEIFDG